MNNPSFKEFVRTPDYWFAFGFGSGLVPKAPGTFGTLAAIPFFWLMQDLSWPIYLSWLVVAFALGCFWCERAAKKMGVHDHGAIVWDEFVGYWITMFMAPKGVLWMLVGFLIFRVFDILKPWPINWLDHNTHGGLGIMVDDVLAGVFSCIVLQVLAYVFL